MLSALLALCEGNPHRSCRPLISHLMLARMNGWTNSRMVGDLKRLGAEVTSLQWVGYFLCICNLGIIGVDKTIWLRVSTKGTLHAECHQYIRVQSAEVVLTVTSRDRTSFPIQMMILYWPFDISRSRRTMVGVTMPFVCKVERHSHFKMWSKWCEGKVVYETDCFGWLSYLLMDKMATISQTTFSKAFSWTKRIVFRFRFHWICLIDNKAALVQVMAWRRTSDNSLSELMLTQFIDVDMRH